MLPSVPKRLFLPLPIGLDPGNSRLQPLLCQRHLRRRVDGHRFHLLDRPLAFRVKRADRIHLVSPKLDPHRQFLRQRENIDDTSADGKLAHTVHLSHPLIAHGGQPDFDLFNI